LYESTSTHQNGRMEKKKEPNVPPTTPSILEKKVDESIIVFI
jgi:hypothetical protein